MAIQDIIEYKGKHYQVSTIKENGCYETMIFPFKGEIVGCSETKLFPVKHGVVSGNQVYCFRTTDAGESQAKHGDIYYHPEKYVSEEAIEKYLKENQESVNKPDNDSIYIVTLRDYDRDDIVGYFTSYEEAENCRKYLDMTDPSLYNVGWCIEEFGHDTTDYDSKYRTTLEELQCSLTERQEEIIRETELAELARLKAKYEGV